jgi:hypothetical protein
MPLKLQKNLKVNKTRVKFANEVSVPKNRTVLFIMLWEPDLIPAANNRAPVLPGTSTTTGSATADTGGGW